jgi:putative ABC transport system permease protein
VVLLTAAMFASLSASVLLRLDLTSAFRGGRTETGRAQRRPFSALIIAEVACAVVLTICAGLLVRSFIRVHAVDLGFQPQRVLSAYLRTNYNDPKGYVFWNSVLSASATLPGATSSAISDCMPSARANTATLLFNDRPNDPDHLPSSEGCWISADYFRTLGVPLLHGRFFSDRDDATAPAVVIINDEAARQFFPHEDPVGKRIAVNYLALGSRPKGAAPRMREIVGVVSNVRQRALDLPPEPAIYMPYSQDETYHVLNSMDIYVRSAPGLDPAALANGLRTRIESLYPNQPVERIQALPQVVARSIARRTYSVALMTAFAVLALLLCWLGIYGVVSYVTQQRSREFGIRMAMGATRRHVVRDVLRQGGVLVGVGTIIGIAFSVLAMPVLSQFLFETSAFDPAVFCSAVLLLGAIGVLACVVPSIRASRLEPRTALGMD